MAVVRDVEVIEDPAVAVVALDPVRARLLAELTTPASATTLADRLGIATIGVRLGDGSIAVGVDRWDDVVVAGAAPERVEIEPDDDATILYTSGTTGRPKGAVSTHRAVVQALMGFSCKVAIDSMRRPTEAAGRTGAPAGVVEVIAASTASEPALPGVEVAPGATVFTRTPSGPYSAAQVRVNCSTAALLAV